MDRDLDPNLDYSQECNLDRDPEDVPVYRGYSLFTLHHIVFHFSVIVTSQSIFIWIKIIQIAIQIKCLHGMKYLDPECDLDRDPNNV